MARGSNGYPAVPRDDEISTRESGRLARAALQPSDPPAIAHFLWLGYWLISEVKVSSPDLAGDSIDLVAAPVDASHGIVEHAIFGEHLVNRCTPAHWVVLAEDVVKIAGQQGRYAVGHGCLFLLLGPRAACANVPAMGVAHGGRISTLCGLYHWQDADGARDSRYPELT